jgi:hypothetical protein
VAAPQFGVGGDGQLALGAGGLVPVGAVGHNCGEYRLALPVGLLQGLVAGGQHLFGRGVAGVAALGGGAGLGGGAQGGQGFVPGGPDVRGGRDGFGADRVSQMVVAGQFAPGADRGGSILPGQPA